MREGEEVTDARQRKRRTRTESAEEKGGSFHVVK